MSDTTRPRGARPTAPGSVTPGPGTRRAGPAQLAVLLAASCMPVLATVLIAPVLALIAAEHAGDPGAAFLVPAILTAPALLLALAAPFSGVLADRIDRRWAMVAALVAYGVIGTAPVWLGSLTAIVVSRVLLGACEAVIVTCCTSLIGDYWQGARRARYLGLQVLVGVVGATVFLVVGGLLGAGGWRTPFWLYGSGLLLALPAALLLWRPTAATAAGPAPAVDRGSADGDPAGGRVPWRALIAPLLLTLAGGVVFHALWVELSFVLAGLGVTDTAVVGGISSLMALAAAAGAWAFGRLSRRSTRALLTAELALCAIGLALVAAAPSVVVVTVGAVLAGLGNGLLFPTLLTWTVHGLSFAQRGRGTGFWYGAWNTGQFLCPLLLTAVAVVAGGLGGALAVLAVLALAVLVAVQVVLRDVHGPLVSPTAG